MSRFLQALYEEQHFIPSDERSPRQNWAHNALTQHFHAAGRDLEEGSPDKDWECIDFLLGAGYEPGEIGPIMKHFNAVVSCARAQDASQQNLYVAVNGLMKDKVSPTPPPKTPSQPAP